MTKVQPDAPATPDIKREPSSRPPRSTLGPTLGIAGGGQLARMTALAAAPLGCQVVVLERSANCPAAAVASDALVGDWSKLDDLLKLAAASDVITFENEFVDAGLVKELEARGYVARPSAHTLGLVQDKLRQKQVLAEAGISLAPFLPVSSPADIVEAGAKLGWPLVLKKRRDGYDGKGNHTVRSAADVDAAWTALAGEKNALYVEGFCSFAAELATMVVRSPSGEHVVYPVVETIQRDHICHIVKAPAAVPTDLAQRAAQMALRAAEAVGTIGAMGVEMFLTREGKLLINELAPRVHNSGHYTIEACECSQFENHVRAVLGWPLGTTTMRAPAAAMINLLGSGKGSGQPTGISDALAVHGAHIHTYGKETSSPGRKMGHVTALGASPAEATATAERAARAIVFGATL